MGSNPRYTRWKWCQSHRAWLIHPAWCFLDASNDCWTNWVLGSKKMIVFHRIHINMCLWFDVIVWVQVTIMNLSSLNRSQRRSNSDDDDETVCVCDHHQTSKENNFNLHFNQKFWLKLRLNVSQLNSKLILNIKNILFFEKCWSEGLVKEFHEFGNRALQ